MYGQTELADKEFMHRIETIPALLKENFRTDCKFVLRFLFSSFLPLLTSYAADKALVRQLFIFLPQVNS